MVPFPCFALVTLFMTAGATRIDATRMDRQEEKVVQVELVHSNISDCTFGMGQCCSTKCEGRSDAQYKGQLSNCNVEKGRVFNQEGDFYKCREECTLKAEAAIQFDLSSLWSFGKKKKETRYITKHVAVYRTGGSPYPACRSVVS
ncbi:unnamed protein product [Effrenium voratum]|nr:unnamed protein product [Effrenium voratum]